MPTYRKKRDIEKLCRDFKDLDSVTISLQSDSMTVSQVQCIFDSITAEFPSTKESLSASADLVQNVHFEVGITKIEESHYNKLSPAEKKAMEIFKVTLSEEETVVASLDGTKYLSRKELLNSGKSLPSDRTMSAHALFFRQQTW